VNNGKSQGGNKRYPDELGLHCSPDCQRKSELETTRGRTRMSLVTGALHTVQRPRASAKALPQSEQRVVCRHDVR
jgi:hypothetical protein